MRVTLVFIYEVWKEISAAMKLNEFKKIWRLNLKKKKHLLKDSNYFCFHATHLYNVFLFKRMKNY